MPARAQALCRRQNRPAAARDRAAVAAAVLRRYDHTLVCDVAALESLCEGLGGYSNADLEALVLLGLEYLGREPALTIADALHKAKADFMPPQERDMIDFMEMLAVSETSRRSLLPPRYSAMPLEEIQQKLRDARRRALGR